MNAVKVYSTGTCPICVKAKAFLDKRGPEFTGRTSDMPPFYPWQD